MHSVLVDVVEAFLWKVHHYGLPSLGPQDIRDLDDAMGQEKMRHDEAEASLEEFADAMDSPRGDEADRRRKAALTRVRKAREEIRNARKARDGRASIERERSFPST